MNNEFLKMQKLAGLITEGQYKEKMNEENTQKGTISFGTYENVPYNIDYNDNIVTLNVTDSDNFGKIESTLLANSNRDYYTKKEISILSDKIEELADQMSEYLTSIGVENEILDNPIGYGQEIDNLVIDINYDDFDKLK
jgi:Mg2+ and Co2+ transporter CorA